MWRRLGKIYRPIGCLRLAPFVIPAEYLTTILAAQVFACLSIIKHQQHIDFRFYIKQTAMEPATWNLLCLLNTGVGERNPVIETCALALNVCYI